jgi:predicted nuclease of predicted toxin-antitoxin system
VGQRGVKLFIDECLSPQLALRLNLTGRYDAVHPLHVGRRGEPDHLVLAWCIAEDRVIVTQNARDFRRLLAKVELHPGLIILPGIDREGTWKLLQAALEFADNSGNAPEVMMNHVLEVDGSGTVCYFNCLRPANGS